MTSGSDEKNKNKKRSTCFWNQTCCRPEQNHTSCCSGSVWERQPTLCGRSLMQKVTLPEDGAAEESGVTSYMEKRGSWRVISNTWNWVLEWREGRRVCENKHPVNIIQDHKHLLNSHTHTLYLSFPPTKALMCRSTGMSLGGTIGTRMQPDRFWALGWTTWLSPSNIPSAKTSTARMIVSEEDTRRFVLTWPMACFKMFCIGDQSVLPFGVEMQSSTWAFWVSVAGLTDSDVWSWVLAGMTPTPLFVSDTPWSKRALRGTIIPLLSF